MRSRQRSGLGLRRASPEVLATDTSVNDGSSDFTFTSGGRVNVQPDVVISFIIGDKTGKLSTNDSGNKNGSTLSPCSKPKRS